MKKEYIKPTSSVMELDYTGMLCNSGGETSKHFTPSEQTTLPVRKDDSSVWDSEPL